MLSEFGGGGGGAAGGVDNKGSADFSIVTYLDTWKENESNEISLVSLDSELQFDTIICIHINKIN
jgi:hypothetical protein